EFSTLTDDEVSLLFCFLCSDSGPPDFTDTGWLDLLIRIRQEVYDDRNPVTREEAQQTLDRLKSRDYLWEDQDKITEDTKDETMYRIASIDCYIPFYYSSYDTASVYLRSGEYNIKPGEKCVICDGSIANILDSLLILRLQMNILTHVTMEDTGIYEIKKILNIPDNILNEDKDKRKQFLMDLRREGEAVHYRGRSQDSVDHVTWLWRYGRYNRPDIVRSCIGRHLHWDIYIIDNKPYRKPSKKKGEHLNNPPDVRCLLYSLLLTEKYQLNLNEQSHRIIRDKIRDKYFPDITVDGLVDLPKEITETHNGVITFISDDIRHDVMYAFVTECLVGDSDLEFFLTTASRAVISEYCRSWDYKRSEGERCLYVPNRPEKMYDLFIDKLQLDIISHCTVSDEGIHDRISKKLKVPRETLDWDQEARERYVEYAKRGTQTVHHARGIIVGCAGAGKTTLLKRLLGCSEEEIKEVKSTEGLQVHEEIFELCDETKSLQGIIHSRGNREKGGEKRSEPSVKTLTFFDFGGQCAYYACHQIYLTRRAFYIVVVDASKDLDQVVDTAVCDQMDTVFSGWTYSEYFVFWLKSIHTYCSPVNHGSEDKVEVLIVATHWDKTIYKDKKDFLQSLYNVLPNNSHLSQYLREDRCFLAQFPPFQSLGDLERCIIDITLKSKWSEKIPHEWIFLNDEINEKNNNKPMLTSRELCNRMPVEEKAKEGNAFDMLRYYHDAGKCLFFNETRLRESVVIDVQWFINAFKTIITDNLHVQGIIANKKEWKEYYSTGNLEDSLLVGIWKSREEEVHTKAKTTDIDARQSNDSSYVLHKAALLSYMMRLGLLAVGEKCHYVPCMNKRKFDTDQKEFVQKLSARTSVKVFLFDFLPFFLFYRLVVALMQREELEVLRSKGTQCLYKNAAMFNFRHHYFVIAVTVTSIQLQILHSEEEGRLEKDTTLEIKWIVNGILKDITNTFHKNLSYKTGFTCVKERDQIIGIEIDDNFIEEEKLRTGTRMNCPLHQVEDHHTINPDYLTKFWM
ncbi:uncharacterized protein LOC134259323, partial [Saccostrea cucullata]|uniref:uncharacterized protein LOC134259323 n=1 Tax=Saccostrea cuccullata TaxID=36930 RepID=UPI002ED39E52